MELREIEIFLTSAEEPHFGRTADRLHLTPARISRSVKEQERRIGAPLFERPGRPVATSLLRPDLSLPGPTIASGVGTINARSGIRTQRCSQVRFLQRGSGTCRSLIAAKRTFRFVVLFGRIAIPQALRSIGDRTAGGRQPWSALADSAG
ncbi:LysR family transcriptional regulator [Saccharopolyspora sp. NPDC050642]|uniref:helix-turn-helix domain-containing protein n=1 Tax=Saccharopolyspora sp. NPDC050642 TaxID=3157099 RepID=UPI0033E02A62